MKKFLISVIKFYRRKISPALPPMCRYYPTCSQYALQAIEIHGGCNILFPGGYEPVPPKKDKRSKKEKSESEDIK